ncbi:MAG TPA: hypothetical protein VGF56_06995 [Rhizomicrobium sp.]|jgi:hypothetical protein
MSESERPQSIAFARLALGLAQGLVLYLLYRAASAHGWPANDRALFAPLLLAALYVPLLASQALGTIRVATLLVWCAVAAAAIAWAGWYDRFHTIADVTSPNDILPETLTFVLGFAGLFIAQALVVAGDRERRIVARYASYFEAAWKQGVQMALAAVFVGVFWLVLWLGAGLFGMIKLSFLRELLEKEWFFIPATTLATAASIELTDVRARLVAGLRSVLLSLLGWLLSLLALIAVGFLCGLAVTGLAPLWATKEAAGGLLTAVAALVILINAAYQNGEEARPLILRIAMMAGMIVLAPLALIAAYALALRVGQYGWTVSRLVMLYCVIVACCYAAGYAVAALLARGRDGRMALLEYANIAAAALVLLLLGTLVNRFTDPMKIATDDQVARLRSGKVAAADFDYFYLNAETGRFGRRALEKLTTVKTGKDADTIRTYAQHALKRDTPEAAPTEALDVARNVAVYPASRALPESFAKQDWSATSVDRGAIPTCLTLAGYRCEAVFADIDGDGTDEIIVITMPGATTWWGTVMQHGADGRWQPMGDLRPPHCAGDIEALRAGTYRLAAPPPPPRRDIVVGDHIIALTLPEMAPPLCAR